MHKYERKTAYDRKTGKPDGDDLVEVGTYCDYCGKFYDEDSDVGDVPTITINENPFSEASWYELRFKDEELDARVLFGRNPDYFYCTNYSDDTSCSADMIKRAAGKLKGRDLFLFNLMEENRLRVAEELLASGVTPDELGLTEEDF